VSFLFGFIFDITDSFVYNGPIFFYWISCLGQSPGQDESDTLILLAAVLKDNRAFCKYGCPIPPLQKLGARFSLMRIQANRGLCNECGACEKVCPMNIQLLEYIKRGKRILSSECILCQTCVRICPSQALKATFGMDAGFKEFIHFKETV
jgi:ferredoxin-type protein NapH